MFRCRKGGKDPTPRKEGAGNPSKSAGHMLEERETRVLYYSRAAPRYNVNPPPQIFNTGWFRPPPRLGNIVMGLVALLEV